MKIINTIIIIFIFTYKLYSQQDPQFAHNTENLLFTNPASAGMLISKDEICATIINNRKWVGLKGAPVTTVATIHKYVKLGSIPGGVGLTIIDDRLGFQKNFQTKLAYSFHKPVGAGKIGIGIEIGLINKDIQATWVPPETSAEEDVMIPGPQVRKMVFDAGLGFFYVKNNIFLGLSVSHIHQPSVKFPGNEAALFLRRHYYFTSGYSFRIFDSPIEILPSVHFKFDGTKLQHSYNVRGLYNKRFWLGVSYRNKEAFIPMAGIKLATGLTVGYAYELPLTKMISYSKGTHEIMVGYCFGFFKVAKNYNAKGVRYF